MSKNESNRQTRSHLVSLPWVYVNLLITALVAFGGFLATLFCADIGKATWANLLVLVFFTGATGAVVNNFLRISKLADLNASSGSALKSCGRMFSSVQIWQLYVSLLISGAFGFCAYGLFLSGLLEGSLFPRFDDSTRSTYSSLGEFLNAIKPATNMDAAKAIIWSFIAGFSEKLIPSALDRITETIGEEEEEHHSSAPESANQEVVRS